MIDLSELNQFKTNKARSEMAPLLVSEKAGPRERDI